MTDNQAANQAAFQLKVLKLLDAGLAVADVAKLARVAVKSVRKYQSEDSEYYRLR